MADKKTFTVALRRRKTGHTDYRKRLALLKSKQHRVVIRQSNNGVLVECMAFEQNGDRVLARAASRELKTFGVKKGFASIPAGYLTGLLAGQRMQHQKIGRVILDLGLQNAHHGGVLFATAKGVLDAGIDLNVNADVFPSNERLNGQHIKGFDINVNQVKETIMNSKAKVKPNA